jgi:hypothetical protein
MYFSPKGPYKQFRASGIEFNFVDPLVSYVAQDTGKEVRLPINPSQPVPEPKLVLDEKSQLQLSVMVFLELVVCPPNPPSGEMDRMADKVILFVESLKSTSNPNRREALKRSRSEINDSDGG